MAGAPGSVKPRVLCVDDEPQVLEGVGRVLRRDFEVLTATSGTAGLTVLEESGPIPVVVSDMRMPEMDGAAFLAAVRDRWPDTTRILLTGQADIGSAASAVNDGGIFRFLLKPTPREQLIRALSDGVAQHELVVAERELLQGTLRGAVEVLTEVLSLVNPVAFGRARRISDTVRHLGDALSLEEPWRYEVAAMLSQLGCVTLPVAMLERVQAGQPLDGSEQAAWDGHPAVAARLIEPIPRLGRIADIVAGQHDPPPAWDPTDRVSVGRTLLALALEIDHHIVQGRSTDESVSRVRRDGRFPERMLGALDGLTVALEERVPQSVRVGELVPGMLLDEDVVGLDEVKLVARGHQVTPTMIERLRAHDATNGVKQPVRVLVTRPDGWAA